MLKVMWWIKYKKSIVTIILGLIFYQSYTQKLIPFKLPDTGQLTGFTSTPGEDADIVINSLSFTGNGDSTVTDNNTGLMWQKTDGGEMTFEDALAYAAKLALGGYTDWRLPTAVELFSINDYDHIKPALDPVYFTTTQAEYWWSGEKQTDDTMKIWVVNAGGGIGAHLRSETVSAGGTRKIHVRAVRNIFSTVFTIAHFTDNGDGTIKDNYTGLTWQKIQPSNLMTWEEALAYGTASALAGKNDWRLPDVKELQSLTNVKLSKPTLDKNYFINILSGNYWTSTTMLNDPLKAWDINVDYGLITYHEKTVKQNVLLVRGGMDNTSLNISEALIPAGEFEMGDHFGFVDPGHPSDETPIHTVKVDSFYMAVTETTNQQFLEFLNSSLAMDSIEVRNKMVYCTGDTNILFYTNQYASYYSIGYDGKVFSITDFRANHPVVGVRWFGAAAFCNWLSLQNGLRECYDLKTGDCYFLKNGYRLPTEAEWEFAGRGGHLNPYFNYPTGDSIYINAVNLPNSGDPYETGSYPNTTPVGFYDGLLKQKSDYNWPGNAATYQNKDDKNGFGLYDMQGNVWEFVNDWYGQNYYSLSTYDNPKGPASGFIMPDGKPYRGMRGGNWYNGLLVNGINDGHSRVSNRNPSYYRGPQDPNHPYYHLGFRVARYFTGNSTGIDNSRKDHNVDMILGRNYPNPFNTATSICIYLPWKADVVLKIYNSTGIEVETLVNGKLNEGSYQYRWNAENCPGGIYWYVLQTGDQVIEKQMILLK